MSEGVQILAAATWQWVVEHMLHVFLWIFQPVYSHYAYDERKNHIKICCSEFWTHIRL